MSRRRPKPPRSRAEAKQATRAALIDAGIAEIAASGLEASLDAICARADLTRGAFYVHFSDRDAFLVAVMQQVLGGFITTLTGRPEVASITTAIGAFFAAARARSPLVHGSAGLRFHHVMEACRRSPQIGATYRGAVMLGRDQLARGLAGDQRAGRARADLPAEALADLLVVAALGVTTMLELELPLDLARLAGSMQGLVRLPAAS